MYRSGQELGEASCVGGLRGGLCRNFSRAGSVGSESADPRSGYALPA